MPLVFAVLLVAMLALEAWTHAQLMDARVDAALAQNALFEAQADLAHLRRLARDQFAILPSGGSVHDLLHIVNSARPVGASMHECLDEMQKALDAGWESLDAGRKS